MISRVFVDLDNTLLPFDTALPVWRAILKCGLRPKLSRITFHHGSQSIAKSILVSCFTELPLEHYRLFFHELANKFIKDVDPSVRGWAESLLQDKSKIHIVTGSLLPLAEGIAENLGWGQSVGTDIETKGNLLTGRLNGISIKGSQKLEAIKRVFHLKNQDFRSCAAAGDSYNDRYLLERCSVQYFPKQSSRRLIRYFTSR